MDFSSGDIITVRAKPNSSKSKLEWNDEKQRFDAFLQSVPDKGKANAELIKLFKKQLKIKAELINGEKSRDKKFKVL